MFLAGLLHDVGIILEDQHIHGPFFAVIRSLDKEKTLSQVEREILGFDHAELGERVGRGWGFPEAVLVAIRYHHESFKYKGPEVDALRCVEVANLICSIKGVPSVGAQLVRVPQAALRALELGKRDLVVLAEDLDEEIRTNQSLFCM
jgi:HD-like signal output (HDOD) protein